MSPLAVFWIGVYIVIAMKLYSIVAAYRSGRRGGDQASEKAPDSKSGSSPRHVTSPKGNDNAGAIARIQEQHDYTRDHEQTPWSEAAANSTTCEQA